MPLSVGIGFSAVMLWLAGCGDGTPSVDARPRIDAHSGPDAFVNINTCGPEQPRGIACTPGNSCSVETWEHGCTCSCDDDGYWNCQAETVGSECGVIPACADNGPSQCEGEYAACINLTGGNQCVCACVGANIDCTDSMTAGNCPGL